LDFDEHLTSSARLSIIACLIPGEQRTFMELKKRTGIADGNLHVQTRKLESAGYLEIQQVLRGRRPLTRFRITELGREALRLHIRKLQSILAAETGRIAPRSGPSPADDSQVWS